ncbi:uncharacterized protein ASCRUDRAFT_71023 [Ascoidea rubescens DSM 1968]|uniref:Uncharacterized protein n=1 Tax=Ascoidea rubescens DSM 1968 TaxID=1344418 RepID=A0A1D2VFT1_9ASCO|nr:hypothetical protein ASCRUDRAFT_71023 [Ascoidea rubescens DSM 1968]ODV60534.1 hypothetical protein ASCRUDRAFT_71023 [Ascoidea rubescens DSM 1968]
MADWSRLPQISLCRVLLLWPQTDTGAVRRPAALRLHSDHTNTATLAQQLSTWVAYTTCHPEKEEACLCNTRTVRFTRCSLTHCSLGKVDAPPNPPLKTSGHQQNSSIFIQLLLFSTVDLMPLDNRNQQ